MQITKTPYSDDKDQDLSDTKFVKQFFVRDVCRKSKAIGQTYSYVINAGNIYGWNKTIYGAPSVIKN